MNNFKTLVAVEELTFAKMAAALKGTGAEDEDGEEGNNRALTQILLCHTPRGVPYNARLLSITTPEEVAALIALGASLATVDNKKAMLAEAGQGLPGIFLIAAYEAAERAMPYQQLIRKTNGSFDCHLDGLKVPKAALSAIKLSQLLESTDRCLALAKDVDWSDEKLLRCLSEVTAGRASHLTRLSGNAGGGGFLKTEVVGLENPYTVSEEDYLTPDTQSFSGNSGIQKFWMFPLPLVSYNGTKARIPDLLAGDEALFAEVVELLTQAGAKAVAPALEILRKPVVPTVYGESQVFCERPGQDAQSLSVMAPFSFSREILRARDAIRESFSAEYDANVLEAEHAIEGLTAAVAELKAQDAPSTREGKAARKAEIVEAQENLASRKAAAKAISKGAYIADWSMPVGGAIPRNIACGLGLEIHSTNIFTSIATSKRQEGIGRKVFYGQSLVQPPELRKASMPPYFKTSSKLTAEYRARSGVFAELALACLGQLIELRSIYREFAASSPESMLAEDASTKILSSNSGWSVFVNGDVTKNLAQLTEALEPLTRDVVVAVKQSLVSAYGKEFPNHFDAELQAAVSKLIRAECA